MDARDCPPSLLLPERTDRWAQHWFAHMLQGQLSTETFEATVERQWSAGSWVLRAPTTARWLRARALRNASQDAGYAHDAPELGFHSQWLVGVPGRPGAIHIEAPAEQGDVRRPSSLNRPLHRHDSARVGLITSGRARFVVERPVREDRTALQVVPVQAGDLIFWPAWTDHTFDAGEGFSLVSAMARYVAPDADGFIFPPGAEA